MSNPTRIDVHQHIVPPDYANWLMENGIKPGGGSIPNWSVEDALNMMDKHRITTGILSVSSPGVHLGNDEQARVLARQVNEFTASVVSDYPYRFGFFATLTLPDVDSAITEAIYAMDELHASGVVLLTNSHGRYLGDKDFDPLMQELNRRHAVVFVHPTDLPRSSIEGKPSFAADFLLDITRAAINLIVSGTMTRYTNLKVILSHAGGFIPYAAHQIAPICSPDHNLETGLKNLRRFYFDTALSGSPTALPSLLAFANPSHILYGSDSPFAPVQTVSHFTGGLDTYPLVNQLRSAINRLNAEALFPQFTQSQGWV